MGETDAARLCLETCRARRDVICNFSQSIAASVIVIGIIMSLYKGNVRQQEALKDRVSVHECLCGAKTCRTHNHTHWVIIYSNKSAGHQLVMFTLATLQLILHVVKR